METPCGNTSLSQSWWVMFENLKSPTSREPAPTRDYARVKIGDVGFIRSGQFHLLFSAGSPLGERLLGRDVPITFEPLTVGRIVSGRPRPPGCLHTITVRDQGAPRSDVLYVALFNCPPLISNCATQAPRTWREFLIRAHRKSWCSTGDKVSDIPGRLRV